MEGDQPQARRAGRKDGINLVGGEGLETNVHDGRILLSVVLAGRKNGPKFPLASGKVHYAPNLDGCKFCADRSRCCRAQHRGGMGAAAPVVSGALRT